MISPKIAGQALVGLALAILLPLSNNYLSEKVFNTRQVWPTAQLQDPSISRTAKIQLTQTARVDYRASRDAVYRTKALLASGTGLAAIVAGLALASVPLISAGLILGGTISITYHRILYWLPHFTTIRLIAALMALLLLLCLNVYLARRKRTSLPKQAAVGLSVMMLLPMIMNTRAALITPQPDPYDWQLNPAGLTETEIAEQIAKETPIFEQYLVQFGQRQALLALLMLVLAVVAGLKITSIPFLNIGLILGGVNCLVSVIIQALLKSSNAILEHPLLFPLAAGSFIVLLIYLFVRFQMLNVRR